MSNPLEELQNFIRWCTAYKGDFHDVVKLTRDRYLRQDTPIFDDKIPGDISVQPYVVNYMNRRHLYGFNASTANMTLVDNAGEYSVTLAPGVWTNLSFPPGTRLQSITPGTIKAVGTDEYYITNVLPPSSVTINGTPQGTLNNLIIPATNVDAYRGFAIQLQPSGTWNGQVTLECSDDQVTWFPLNAFQGGVSNAYQPTFNNAQMLFGSLYGTYFRLRVSTWVAGTMSAILKLYYVVPNGFLNSFNINGGQSIALVENGALVSNANPLPMSDSIVGTQVTASVVVAAAAAGIATLPGAVGKTTYLRGFNVSSAPVAAAVNGLVTVTGTIGGALNYQYNETVASGGSLTQPFGDNGIAANAQNTAIVVNLPAIVGGGASAIAAWGVQI